jgi:ATP-dependent Clp protease ATP-binding subunit ClpA
MKLKFSSNLIEFLSGYDQLAEDGARSVDDKVKTLLEKPLVDALFSKRVSLSNDDEVSLGVKPNKDGTFNLTVNNENILMDYTEKERASQPISDAEILKLKELEAKLSSRVKGIKSIIHQLAKDIRKSANSEKIQNPELGTKPADVYLLLVSSSTGKTELALALHQILYSTPTKPLVIDFSQIHTIDDLKNRILGKRDHLNQAIPSDFMQEYDRRNGQLVVVLDEISNANPEVLKALYDLLREPGVRTFSDRKARRGKIPETHRTPPRSAPEPGCPPAR